MMKRLAPQIADLRAQIHGNPRLKWALIAIAILGGLFVLQGLDSLRVGMQKNAIDEEVTLRRIRALQGQDIWLQRETDSKTLRDALQAQIPSVATPGLAQAALQSWLQSLVANAGAGQDARITVETAAPVETMPSVLRVRAVITLPASPRQSLALIRQLESATNLVIIETIDIRNDNNAVFNAGVNAYYRLQSAEAKP